MDIMRLYGVYKLKNRKVTKIVLHARNSPMLYGYAYADDKEVGEANGVVENYIPHSILSYNEGSKEANITVIDNLAEEALSAEIEGIDITPAEKYLLAVKDTENFIQQLKKVFLASMIPFIDEQENISVLTIPNYISGAEKQKCVYTRIGSEVIETEDVEISEYLSRKLNSSTQKIIIDMLNNTYTIN